VVVDKPQNHDDTETLRLIEAGGKSVKLLPPYSPDSNPIEKMRNKIKNLFRELAAHTQTELELI
jgi:transposase